MDTEKEAMTPELKYYVLGDSTNPYLLARIRWPDVSHAITAGCRDWQDDIGLFDLPYDPGASPVTTEHASAIASGWGTTLPLDTEVSGLTRPLIRRMPANWSNLSRAEVYAWSLEPVFSRRASDGSPAVLERRGPFAMVRRMRDRRSASVSLELAQTEASERRRHARVPVGGVAQIRHGSDIVSADIVDFSPGGAHWVFIDSNRAFMVGETIEPPFVLEQDGPRDQLRLNVSGTIVWHKESQVGSHVGVAFGKLSKKQVDRIGHLLETAGAKES